MFGLEWVIFFNSNLFSDIHSRLVIRPERFDEQFDGNQIMRYVTLDPLAVAFDYPSRFAHDSVCVCLNTMYKYNDHFICWQANKTELNK